MEFLRSFLRRHLTAKPVVTSPNVDCFLRLSNAGKISSNKINVTLVTPVRKCVNSMMRWTEGRKCFIPEPRPLGALTSMCPSQVPNSAELYTGTRNYILTLLDQTYLLTLLFSLLVNKWGGLFQDLKKEMILITSRQFCLARQSST